MKISFIKIIKIGKIFIKIIIYYNKKINKCYRKSKYIRVKLHFIDNSLKIIMEMKMILMILNIQINL
jgi:hypothetical protein